MGRSTFKEGSLVRGRPACYIYRSPHMALKCFFFHHLLQHFYLLKTKQGFSRREMHTSICRNARPSQPCNGTPSSRSLGCAWNLPLPHKACVYPEKPSIPSVIATAQKQMNIVMLQIPSWTRAKAQHVDRKMIGFLFISLLSPFLQK